MKRLLLCVLVLACLIISSFVGQMHIPLDTVFYPYGAPGVDETVRQVFWQLRVPRVCLAFLSGAALSIGGMVFQSVFQNFLACPFTLGVSTGAAFGAALYFRLGCAFALWGISGASFSAFAGALGTIFFVYGVSAGLSTASMLLAGVVMSFFFSSLIVFLQYISDFEGMFRIMRWLMGGFETVGWASVWGVFPFVAAGTLLVKLLERELDLLTLGDELAASRGIRVSTVRAKLFFATSLMVGGVVSVCGPIGFVGIMVPHFCRLLFGSIHRGMTATIALIGGVFLVICDTFGRVVVAPYEVPVGVVTALLGGPFFLWLLIRRRRVDAPVPLC